jgi:predicted SnoaL-like aldol condensation-catalyzing enzyme
MLGDLVARDPFGWTMTAACGTLGTWAIAHRHRWLGLGPTKEDLMKGLITLGAVGLLVAAAPAFAQEPVTGAADAEALFTSPDPKLHRNKQAAYHIQRDLLEAGHWELADRWLTERYVQHNPNAASGRDAVVAFFTKVLKVQPKPIPEKLTQPVVAVVAEGDYVVVITPRVVRDPKDATKTYTTGWFDMWRFVDGKADEHWDGATKMSGP